MKKENEKEKNGVEKNTVTFWSNYLYKRKHEYEKPLPVREKNKK